MGSKAESIGKVTCWGAKLFDELEEVSFGSEDGENCWAEFCGDWEGCDG